MSIYRREYEPQSGGGDAYYERLYAEGRPIYGSSRLGLEPRKRVFFTQFTTTGFGGDLRFMDRDYTSMPSPWADEMEVRRDLGYKRYELANHLGNVLTTVSDRKLAVPDAGTPELADYYTADIVSVSDYYPFGSLKPGRNFNSGSSRYLFQGQEHDDELHGAAGSSYAFEYRIHDPRIGRFLSIDPLAQKYPQWSPYSFSGNQVIATKELEGLEPNKDMNVGPYTPDEMNSEKGGGTGGGGSGTHAPKSPTGSVIGDISLGLSHGITNGVNELITQPVLAFSREIAPTILHPIDQYDRAKEAIGSMKMPTATEMFAPYLADYNTLRNGTAYERSEVVGRWGIYAGAAVLTDGLTAESAPVKYMQRSLTYDARVLRRAIEDPGFHNFPYSFDSAILSTIPTVEANGYALYRLPGWAATGLESGSVLKVKDAIDVVRTGEYQIGVMNGVVTHRVFIPN